MARGSEPLFDGMRGPHAFTFPPALPAAHPDAEESELLSEVDRRLVQILQLDGRRSFAAIARDLGIPEKTARRRVHELVEDGVIHITTVSYPSLLGFDTIAMVGITVDPAAHVKDVVSSFAELQAVDYAVITTGRYNALIEVLCRDRDELLRFVNEEIPRRAGVRSAEVLPYLDLYYQEPAWDVAQAKPNSASRAEPCPMDSVDYEIMRVLHGNGRAPFALVGQQVGLSESQVRKRVARLVDGHAMRITAIVNPRRLSFDTVVWIAIKIKRERGISELADELTRIPSITYVAITAGRFDILAEAVCRTTEDVMELVDREVRMLDGIADTEVMFCLDLYYQAVQLPQESRLGPENDDSPGSMSSRQGTLDAPADS